MISGDETTLQVADVTEILHLVDGIDLWRQTDLRQKRSRILPLEGEVMNGEDHGNSRTHLAQIDGGKRRLPVMRMHKIRLPAGQGPGSDLGTRKRQHGKALPVVRVVHAMLIDIRAARALVECRRVEDEEAEAIDLEVTQRGLLTQEIVELHQRRMKARQGEDRWVAGDERMGFDAVGGQGLGKGTGHIGQAAGFDQRVNFGGDGKHVQRHARGIMATGTTLFLVPVIGFPHPLDELGTAQRQRKINSCHLGHPFRLLAALRTGRTGSSVITRPSSWAEACASAMRRPAFAVVSDADACRVSQSLRAVCQWASSRPSGRPSSSQSE